MNTLSSGVTAKYTHFCWSADFPYLLAVVVTWIPVVIIGGTVFLVTLAGGTTLAYLIYTCYDFIVTVQPIESKRYFYVIVSLLSIIVVSAIHIFYSFFSPLLSLFTFTVLTMGLYLTWCYATSKTPQFFTPLLPESWQFLLWPICATFSISMACSMLHSWKPWVDIVGSFAGILFYLVFSLPSLKLSSRRDIWCIHSIMLIFCPFLLRLCYRDDNVSYVLNDSPIGILFLGISILCIGISSPWHTSSLQLLQIYQAPAQLILYFIGSNSVTYFVMSEICRFATKEDHFCSFWDPALFVFIFSGIFLAFSWKVLVSMTYIFGIPPITIFVLSSFFTLHYVSATLLSVNVIIWRFFDSMSSFRFLLRLISFASSIILLWIFSARLLFMANFEPGLQPPFFILLPFLLLLWLVHGYGWFLNSNAPNQFIERRRCFWVLLVMVNVFACEMSLSIFFSG